MNLSSRLFFILFFLTYSIQKTKAQDKFTTAYRNVYILQEQRKIESRILTKKQIRTDPNLTYYWYDNVSIHETQGNYSKYLLDGRYIEYFQPSNNLNKKGYFKAGLKHGHWYDWYFTGKLKTHTKWVKGKLSGKSSYYNDSGILVKIERYREGLLNGRTQKMDSGQIKTSYYKDGIAINPWWKTNNREIGSETRESEKPKGGRSKWVNRLNPFKKSKIRNRKP